MGAWRYSLNLKTKARSKEYNYKVNDENIPDIPLILHHHGYLSWSRATCESESLNNYEWSAECHSPDQNKLSLPNQTKSLYHAFSDIVMPWSPLYYLHSIMQT